MQTSRRCVASSSYNLPHPESLKNIPKSQDKKVSSKASVDALFKECLDKIRLARPNDGYEKSTSAIDKLTSEELVVSQRVFSRIDPEKKIIPQISHRDHFIDPYWDPFTKVEELKDQVAGTFAEYSRLVGASEARSTRAALRKQLRQSFALSNPYSKESQQIFQKAAKMPPVPHYPREEFWDATPDWRKVLRNRGKYISFRDVDTLSHFVTDQGFILPRRVSSATRRQQIAVFKGINLARMMALMPYDWPTEKVDRMPLMDPLQFMLDELTRRVRFEGDQRALAMARVMRDRWPDLNYKFLDLIEAKKNDTKNQQEQQHSL